MVVDSRALARDHPREYGENPFPGSVQIGGWGSSPRIRGEYQSTGEIKFSMGIIPANTGRMIVKCMGQSKRWDHPREYGENCD